MKGTVMWKLLTILFLSLVTLPAPCQSTSKYQVATILEIVPHQQNATRHPTAGSYDVSVRVGDTIYVALYTPGLGEDAVKYAAGRDLLVLVGKQTITYNDLMGRSFEVPIESQRSVSATKEEVR
jgi:ABC-type Fe3+-hydroxamate transport system substrate-binding protein